MEIDFNKSNLYKKILSDSNIYNAIYCLESYVFEKGLLDTKQPVCDSSGEVLCSNDLELYYALSDKYNVTLIDKIIDTCKGRLEKLFNNSEDLFEISVFFKLKSCDENGKLKFRPLHTARLTDLICMVCLLIHLMYNDTDKRNLSDLSKLLPHNFYGNVPSTNVQYLFQRWQTKYKEYTNNVIEHCRTYQNNHRYLSEVSLDIQNFFPSIAPKIIYDYIIDKVSPMYYGVDKNVLEVAVSKLLFFIISEDCIKQWQNEYYLDGYQQAEECFYMNCGIAQGLPQSYFFGNLCMIEVKDVLLKDEYFGGDAYFYVDDSVIYVQSALEQQAFTNKIQSLNKSLSDYFNEKIASSSDIEKIVSPKYLKFQRNLPYKIQFHEDGKSVFCLIDDADNHLGGFENLVRETSMSSNLHCNLDEIDDTVTLEKLEAIDKVISREIERIEGCGINTEGNGKNASRLKMLRRFKKFFLYRNRLLKITTEGGPNPKIYSDFVDKFINKVDTLNQWFDQNDEDIFQSEYRLLIQMGTRDEAKRICDEIVDFEKKALLLGNINYNTRCSHLFYSKDVKCSLIMKTLTHNSYLSLNRWVNENYQGLINLNQTKQYERLATFIGIDKKEYCGNKINFEDILEKGYEKREYTCFILNNSSEFQRKLLNAYFSAIVGVHPSDTLSFIKTTSRKLHYTEFRILSRLRNTDFDLNSLKLFIKCIKPEDISNRMCIDMGLLDVLSIFIKYVHQPEWVDTLILTHRVTKGLWSNGSKFLNSYTLHNEEHAVTLINSSIHIIKTIDYFTLKDVDYYILFLSCYLHDISMVIHPDMYIITSSNQKSIAFISELMLKMKSEVLKFMKIDENDNKNSRLKESGIFIIDVFNSVYEYLEKEVREHHSIDSAKFIRDKSNTLLNYLSPTLLNFVAKVSESHGYNTNDVYGLKSRAKDETVSIKYLMILIRLADLMDVANDRVNYHLLKQNIKNMSSSSKFHWISHLVTDKVELSAEYETDEKVELSNKPITEELKFDLYLNVKYLSSTINTNICTCCQCELKEGYINILISNGNSLCSQKKCTFLCRWMMKKHEWLVSELVALNEYLFSVNNSLIKTKINFNIHYRDEMALEAEMFDDVQDYLPK